MPMSRTDFQRLFLDIPLTFIFVFTVVFCSAGDQI
jgi:hypothetical protein